MILHMLRLSTTNGLLLPDLQMASSITLGANFTTQVRSNGEIVTESLVVAHLRGSVQAALNLRMALERALSQAAAPPTPKGKAN